VRQNLEGVKGRFADGKKGRMKALGKGWNVKKKHQRKKDEIWGALA